MRNYTRVVVKNPGERAEIRLIDNDTASLQKIVGGYIEAIRPWPDAHAYVNEEGKLKGLERNFLYGSDIIVGPAVFSKADEEGDEIGFTEREADEILRRVNQL